MNRQFISGASYVDALPTGEYCALHFGAFVETHLGAVKPATPEQGPLFLRCTTVGSFRFAGQQHEGMGALEWDGFIGWRVIPPPACGASPVIYDAAGQLHVSDCSIGSQGYRYVRADGSLATGDQTYYDGPSDLSEWSEYGGLKIGQGHSEGGVIVWDGSTRRLLESGPCTFVRVQGVVDRVSIAFVRPDGAVIIRATLDELRSLPIVPPSGTTSPNPGPSPVPQPVPVPKPEPVPMIDHTDIVRAIRSRYPATIDDPTCFAITNEVANHPTVKAEGLGLLKCPAGARGFVVDGQNYRVQRLCKPDGTLVQVLGSSGNGAAIAEWSVSTGDPNATPANWAPAIPSASSAPITAGVTSGTPIPGTQNAGPGAALDAVIAADHAQLAKIAGDISDIRAEIAAIKATAPPITQVSLVLTGHRIALKADNGKYVSADQGRAAFAPLVADRDAVGGWETFTIEAQP